MGEFIRIGREGVFDSVLMLSVRLAKENDEQHMW